MTESEYLDKLAQTEQDLYFIRQRIKKLGFEIAEAERQKNVTEANKVLHQSLSNLDCEVVSITRSPILEVLRAV